VRSEGAWRGAEQGVGRHTCGLRFRRGVVVLGAATAFRSMSALIRAKIGEWSARSAYSSALSMLTRQSVHVQSSS
jgi:hypothetical protein